MGSMHSGGGRGAGYHKMVVSFADRFAARFGYRLVEARDYPYVDDMPPEFHAIDRRVSPFTQTSVQRRAALYESLQYVLREGIPGDFVECGVWRGGSAMLAAMAMRHAGHLNRKIYLYDTYAGMPEPGSRDVDLHGEPARAKWEEGGWNHADLDDVRRNLARTRYPQENLVFAPGMVEETIPGVAPDTISVLRLDTDFYASTLHELRHLYPRLSPGGVLLIDDYGHFRGAKAAVDEYFSGRPPYMHRVDYTARLIVKG
ncbi:MAG: class I SAM-dependent methyltransferase [Bdellovibrionales bacterium]|nr:class I SAM-dependent methyltransferase [Bdellovibrionales bacterium]